MSFSKVLDVSLLESIPSVVRLARADDIAALVCVAIITVVYLLRGVTWDKPDPYNYVWYEKPQQEDIHGTKTAATRDIGVKLAESNKQIVIFWGSQSGTAEGLANRLARDCRNHFAVDAIACDLQDYDPESIANIPTSKIAIFIVSTYGEGDPSDNATPLMSWLEFNRLTTKVPFQNLQYAAFGLGNKNYRLYNRVIDLLTEALDAMEAKALLPTGKADDSQGTTEEDFTEWKHSLFGMFREKLGLEERPDEYHPSLKVVEDTSLDIIDLHLGEPLRNTNAPSSSQVHHLPVKSAKKLLKNEDRNCLHVEFDISEHVGLKYKTGDHLAVYPSNPEHEIVRLLDVLGLESSKATPLLISSLEPLDKCKIPSPTTLYALFQSYLEICAPVGRETVSALAKFAPSPSAKARLSQLGADKDLYHDYCSKNHVTFGRLLESTLEPGDKSSWSNLPLSFILESLPVLTPRYYSISSSAVISPRRIDITVATSTYNANLQPIPGLTTSYLLNHTQTVNDSQDSRVFAHIRTSKFRLPTAFAAPVILVAAGSGIAPFRAFIAERARMRSLGKAVGKTILFFGCRSASEDFLYQDELKKISEASEGNFEIITAFSRTEVNDKGGKMYVQDRVEERGDEMLKSLMDQDASLYICGSAGMAREVGGRLRSMLVDRLAWNEDRVKEWLERMRKTRKWQEDVWG